MRNLLKFAVFGIVLGACLPKPQSSEPKYEGGEHSWLGDHGLEEACRDYEELCGTKTFWRKDRKETFTYGELVALSGDFYATPEAIYEETRKFATIGKDSLDRLKEYFSKEVSAVENGEYTKYPDFNLRYVVLFPAYVSGALLNDDHFGWNNMLAYANYHDRAIRLAISSFQIADKLPQEAERLWHQAVFMNAFADHFLTDGFAAGHIRVPRTQIRVWGKNQGYNENLIGSLSKLLHDNDGRKETPQLSGLKVTNARGDRWITKSDKELFLHNGEKNVAAALITEAVKLSILDILMARKTGIGRQGIFPATKIVPFPSTDERTLSQTMGNPSDSDVNALVAETAWYLKLPFLTKINHDNVRNLLTNIPSIMADMRKQIGTDLVQKKHVTDRLPDAYKNAFQRID